MKVHLFSLVFALSSLIHLQSYAVQEIELVVADESFSSSNKVVITEKDIKKSHVKDLATLLSAEANVAISSSNFTPNSIFIRGGDSSHVLFLIDGIPYYDPSTIQRTVNLSTLNLRSIKKIEIIKGSQSVLYGGQALAGVIKIETFPQELSTQTDLVLQGGERFAEAVISHQHKLSEHQALSANLKITDAYNPSPAQNSSVTYPQKLSNIDLNYIFQDLAGYDFLIKTQYTNDESQISTFDSATGLSLDTEDFDSQTENINFGLVLRKKDLWTIALSQQQTNRNFFQEKFNSPDNLATDEVYEGLLNIVRLDVKAFENQNFKIDVGGTFNHEEIYQTVSKVVGADNFQEYEGLFIKTAYKPTEIIIAEAGYRKEFRTLKPVADTYQLGLSFDDYLKIEHSTGFKSPSLFQQFGRGGNPDLKPEKVVTSAATLENQLTDQVRGAFTVFTSQYNNLIISQGSPRKYQNVSETKTDGVELYLDYNNADMATKAQLSLGYQEPRDLSSGTWLVRRALRTASLKLNHDVNDQIGLGTEIIHTGSRREQYFTFTPPMTFSAFATTIPAHTLVHVVGRYKINDQTDFFTRAENIFSQQYQTSYGYFVDGPIVRLGINLSL